MNIGIDIGGTKTLIGLVREDGTVAGREQIPSAGASDIESFTQSVRVCTDRILGRAGIRMEEVGFIGAGVPGTVDTGTGQVRYCPNLGWKDVPAGRLFSEAFGRTVLFGQDSRLAALAEGCFGAGRDCSSVFCITLGTGIGAGILINGKIYNGGMNTAGEIGHMTLYRDGLLCACGKRGCLERYASGTGILELAKKVLSREEFGGRPEKCETVFALAKEGNEKALQVIDQAVHDLALGIANAVTLFSPEIVILSGGLSEEEELFIEPLKKLVPAYGYFGWTSQNRLKICKAALGAEAGMIGAAVLGRGL